MNIEVIKLPVTNIEIFRTGPKGKDAYEAWLEAGNVGTLEDFFSYKYNDDTDYALTFLTAIL
jgi:hypothetical protein